MQAVQKDTTRGFRFRPQFPIRMLSPGVPAQARTVALNRAGAILEWTPCAGCMRTGAGDLPETCPLRPHYEAAEGCSPCPIALELPGSPTEIPGTVRAVERQDGKETVWIAFRGAEKEPLRALEEALRVHLFASNLLLYEPDLKEAERLRALWEGVGVPPEREESWFSVMRRLRRGDYLGVIADIDALGALDMGFTLVKSVYPSARVIAIGTRAALDAAKASPVAADVDSFLEKPVAREEMLAALARSASRTGW